MIKPRVDSLKSALQKQRQVRMPQTRSLEQVPAGDQATYSLTEVGAPQKQRQVRMPQTRSLELVPLAVAGAGATYSISIPFISCGTGTSTVCSMMRSEFRSCGTTTCCIGEWTICSTMRYWMRSSVWVSASTRRALLALWCVAVATAHRTANS